MADVPISLNIPPVHISSLHDAGVAHDVEELLHEHLISIDGPPVEVLPHFWVLSGFTAYDGHVPIATFDCDEPPTLDLTD